MESEYQPDDALQDQLETEAIEERDRNAMLAGWGLSMGLHALVALILLFVVVTLRLVDIPVVTEPIAFDNIPVPPIEPPPPAVPTPNDPVTTVITERDILVQEPTVPLLEPIDLESLSEMADQTDLKVPKSHEETVSQAETGSTGAFMAIGAAGGGAGITGNRRGSGQRRALINGGGSRATQNGVTNALRWFKRHQSENGMWDVDGYPVNCRQGDPKCEPGTNRGGADAAVTGYALLCFLGAGYDHQMASEFTRTVQAGLNWLLTQQQEDGSWGRNYENAVCAMALAECYTMTRDTRLRLPAQRAVDYLRQVQNPGAGKDAYGGSGWDYTAQKATRNDSSVTGWCVMALKSAASGGLDVGGSLEGAKWWLEHAWQATNQNWRDVDLYHGTTQFPYTFNEVTGATDKRHLSCVGAACAVFLGHDKGDPLLETLSNDIMARHLESSRAWPTDSYFLYYNTLAIFQVGGPRWQTWNETVLKQTLVTSQRTDTGCFHGSWDPQGAGGHGIDKVGRTLVTAYACLCLEVYYRYAVVTQDSEPH